MFNAEFYGSADKYFDLKSGLYTVNAPVSRGEWAHTLFSSPDPTWHKNVRRAMNPIFTQTAVATYEPLVEMTIETFLGELETRFAGRHGTASEISIDAFTWLSYFTYDVMSDLTYSKRHGFITRGEDVHGIIGWVEKFLAYGFVVSDSAALCFAACIMTDGLQLLHQTGQMPWVDTLLRHNPVLMWLERRGYYAGNTFPGAKFALQRFSEREREQKTNGNAVGKREDLLDKFRKAKQERPEHITNREVLGLSLSTIIAGSEPRSVLRATFFYCENARR